MDIHTYGTDRHTPMGQTDRQTHIWDRLTLPMKNSLHAKFFFVCAPINTKIVLKPPPWPENSKNMLRFQIGWWEGTYFLEQTDRRTTAFFI